MKPRIILTAVLATVCLAGSASAQEAVQTERAAAVDTSAAHVSVASTIDRPSGAVRRAAPEPAAPLPAAGQNMGAAKAQMVVGGAALLVGALIGGKPGTVVMVGGAVVGLYGLWQYLK